MQENSLVDVLRSRQESSWRAGNAIAVADLLKSFEADQVSADDILALVESELRLSQLYHRPVEPQAYIEQFRRSYGVRPNFSEIRPSASSIWFANI